MSFDFSLSRIARIRFRPAAEVEETLDELRQSLLSGEKFRVARLAIARSLAEEAEVSLLPKGTELGTSVKGQHLFGEDTTIWACVTAEAAETISSPDIFKAYVEAHWTRGARLLNCDLEAADQKSAQLSAI